MEAQSDTSWTGMCTFFAAEVSPHDFLASTASPCNQDSHPAWRSRARRLTSIWRLDTRTASQTAEYTVLRTRGNPEAEKIVRPRVVARLAS
jgi:hypothetical protein